MVLPFIGAGIATGIGTVAGLSLGPYIFSALTKPASYRMLREEVDADSKVAAPDHGLLVKTEFREALPLLEPWITEPDYERVAMINRLTATVWPTMTQAILDLVLQGDMYSSLVYPQVKAQVFDKYPFVEDIWLGPHSLRHGRVDTKANPFLEGKLFTVGGVAPRIGGMRVMPTADDEVLMETSMIWGSQATFDVTVVLRFGRLRLVVPLQLANISFKADVRLMLRPLTEKFPCLGGVSISLLRVPTVDFSLKLLKGVDIMALPFVPQIIQTALRVILEPMTIPLLNKPLVPGLGLVLPNAVSFPIMPNFGLPAPPLGALRVTVQRLENVKGGDDLYCMLDVRRGRFKQTRTIDNNRNPVFEEEFALIVDSFEQDSLRIRVYHDDLGWSDKVVAEVLVPFGEVMGIKQDPDNPDKEVTDFKIADFITATDGKALKLPLRKLTKKDLKNSGSRKDPALASGRSFAAAPSASTRGAPPPVAPSAATSARASIARLFTRSKAKKAAKKEAAAAAEAEARPYAGAESGVSDGEGGGGGRLATAPSGGLPGSRPPALTTVPSGRLARMQSIGASVFGGGGDPLAESRDKEDVGTIFLKLQFVPFNPPRYDDVEREKDIKSRIRDPYLSMFPAPPGRTLAMDAGGSGGSKLDVGVLTVHLIRCVDLAPEGAKDLATYVRMMVTNDEKDETQTSTTIVNETSPRWGDKFDFVLIPSTSELHIQVFNRAGMLSNLVGSLFRKKEDKDNSMGKLLVRVEDVARNGRLKDVYSLADAERGYIELSLAWQTCHLSADQRVGG